MNMKIPVKREKLWNKPYTLVNITAFLCFLAEYILSTVLPLYALTIGGNEATAGIFMSVIATTALLVRPLIGHIMDRMSRQLILIFGAITITTVAYLYSISASIPQVLILTMFHGIALSALTTSAPTVVADVTHSSRLEEGISIYGIAMNLTIGVGPVVALYLINHVSFAVTFRIALIIGLSGIVLSYFINYEKGKVRSVESKNENHVLDLKNMFEKSVIKPAIYQFFTSFGMAIVYTFIPIYALSRGVDNSSLFFVFYAACCILISLITGRLVQEYGIFKIFVPSLLLLAISYLCLALAHSLPVMIIAGVLLGFGSGPSMAIINIIGMKLAPANRRGAANATLYVAMDIGIASGSVLLGFVSASFGFTVTFIIAAIMIVIVLILFCFMNKESDLHSNTILKSEPVIDKVSLR